MNESRLSRRQFVKTAAAITAGASVAARMPSAIAKDRRPRVLFFSRAGAYEPAIVHREGGALSVSERLMVDMGRQIGVDVECETNGRVFDGDLQRFDAFVLFWNYDPTKPNKRGEPPITAQGQSRLIQSVASGKGLLGIHCATYAILSGPQLQRQPVEQRDPYVRMLGGELCEALAKQTCRHRIVSPHFPGVAKLKSPVLTVTDEPYGQKNLADDIHVIAVDETEGLRGKTFPRPPFPSIWARRHERGRVFYVSLGHDEDTWRTEAFQSIVLGGLDWVLGRVDADLTPNLTAAAPGAQDKP
ncbi:MAG: ThuA domain-containing protein [Thermoguttaceae bacterium]|jgi:type 1 glutamine amidotransferase